ncbi:sugar phosphate nucleotidyltransferase [Alkalicoccobacillus plakortidis]|uniref:Sugar phosphate nucleotidyltransferase n=1 Tax=Alkalicoccobacillus plakortidis TaxID=444060 RepID=A0ABT0XLB4_9BACI|nr:sugar phosphate nucleotidyltransferase [Alkalicoccobacillus plakortidis]MCM2676703.1 sugar phosphate nucleotidyltransferase [Alkalicoccobacillus plakortidis]
MSSTVKCVAMILAGGAGTRLGALTREESKPAVSFGGSNRIIDYTLSNCIHSGIKHVGVLTQYKPETLHSHLQNSEPKGLTIQCLPSTDSSYEGTADAVGKNIDYIQQHDPTHVLILSGDHIYQMNYQELIDFHRQKDADMTVASIQVSKSEASRFGILSVDQNGAVTEFEEKPTHPKSQIASMGIYLFNWSFLKKCLLADANNPTSSHDFGKDILPTMLATHSRLFAYNYDQYWRDVGTIQTYWETQMDLNRSKSPFKYSQNEWPLFTSYPAAFVPISIQTVSESKKRKISESVISPSAYISDGAAIYQSIILPGSSVGKNVYLHKVIVAENTHIPDNLSFASNDEVMLITQAVVHRYLSKTKSNDTEHSATNQLLKKIK